MILGDPNDLNQTPSTYRGATAVMKDGAIQILYKDAISPQSTTLIRGELSIGDLSTGPIDQNFAKPLVIAEEGSITRGNLSITSLVNAGNVQIDSLTVNNGMDLLIRRLEDQSSISLDSPLYDMQAQGRLKNFGGSI